MADDVIICRDMMVPMRDGVKLCTDLYYPAHNGKRLRGSRPALLARTPYNKEGAARVGNAMFFARHGYIAAVQDCRGRYKSEGEFFPFVDEPEDGYDTVEWLGQQPGCDGQVGTHGGSYLAWVQYQMATLAPPSLKTMIPYHGPTNAFHYAMREGGAFHLFWFDWLYMQARTSKQSKRYPEIQKGMPPPAELDWLGWLKRLPWQPGNSPLALLSEYEEPGFKFYDNLKYNEFWRQRGLGMSEYFEHYPDIPILWVAGWYDYYPRSNAESFAQIVALGKKNQYMLIGPWTHGGFGPTCGELDFGEEARIEYNELQLGWFDYWLKGKGKCPFEKPVNVFVMGRGRPTNPDLLFHGGEWLDADQWPLRETEEVSFYLHPDGSLRAQESEAAESCTTYTYNPDDPVPSVGGWCYVAGMFCPGPRNQVEPKENAPLPLASRADLMVFESQPLEQDLVVVGPVKATLFVSSDCDNTDFTAKVIDVFPPTEEQPGAYALGVCEGILRMSYRDGTKSQPIVPGECYEIEITLFPTANRFYAGHRIRLDISSSNFPRFDLNRNVLPRPNDSRRRIAENTIYHDAKRPSRLIVNVFRTNGGKAEP